VEGKQHNWGKNGVRRYEIIGILRYLKELLLKTATILILSRVSQRGVKWKKSSTIGRKNEVRRYEIICFVRYVTQLLLKTATVLIL
jgi:hypothetical protein